MMKRILMTGALAVALAAGVARDANAQVTLTPFGGVTFGDDAPATKFTAGAGLTFMGGIAGFELDFGYTPDFFGEESDFALIGDSNVTTFSGSLVLGAPIGRVKPYGVVGLGIVRSRISDAEDLFDDLTTNDLALNVGGGVVSMLSDRIGIRGDIRYFRALQDNEDDNDVDVAIGKFGFWRGTAGLTFRF
jgi:opacity protein-like surface antigen